MKIAFSSFGPNLMSQLSPRVRGCQYLLIVDPDNMRLEVFENTRGELENNDRCPAVEYLLSSKVNALVTGRCRKGTFELLTEAGMYIYLKQSGTVKEVLGKYTQGLLQRATRPTSHNGS